ncbi:MAG: hypothetical protein M5U01_13915 [Ardenticatenaceae bacterium]|nr:hypothetical protein [Ardenticatenaceae bacterium]
MDEIVTIAAVQMPWKRVADLTQFRDELYRYLRLAKAKDARLVLLPELIGTSIAAAMLTEEQQQRKARTGVFARLRSALAGPEQTRVADALPQFVSTESQALRAAYLDLFSTAAREHAIWLVAGSLYLRDAGGPVRALSGVFDANGNVHGWQAKLHLADHERALAVPGESLTVFEAPWGRFGVLLGNDLLYPELGRALAYRGVVGIVNPAAATRSVTWKRLRIAALARAQENQVFVTQSFLLGPDELTGENGLFVGRSALSSPVELSPRGDGLLVEVGAETAEGVISGEWNIVALRRLWQDADERPREDLRGPLFAKLLGFDYESGATIAERTAAIEAEAAEQAARAKPLILQSPAWPERPVVPAELPPAPPPDQFLAGIEAEVEEVADLEGARELLEGVQPSSELSEAASEPALGGELIEAQEELPAEDESSQVLDESPGTEESPQAPDELPAEEKPPPVDDDEPRAA